MTDQQIMYIVKRAYCVGYGHACITAGQYDANLSVANAEAEWQGMNMEPVIQAFLDAERER